ncbi:MAG: hypothetical protein ACXVEC_13795 [Nocardioides sp.]
MLRTALVAAPAAVLLLALAGCSGGATPVARDPAGDPASGPSSRTAPTAVPPADGPVRTVGLVTVMDTGTGGPVVCLGAVAESYPPQCSGPAVRGWDWAGRQGVFERSGTTRWGSFALAGSFDGTALTVTDAVPAALYDPAARPDLPGPDTGGLDPKRAEVQRRLEADPLPGTLSVAEVPGAVQVDVVHDDGSLQAYADATYGAGAVRVVSALVPAT